MIAVLDSRADAVPDVYIFNDAEEAETFARWLYEVEGDARPDADADVLVVRVSPAVGWRAAR